MRPAQIHHGDNGRMPFALMRRCRGHDARHACNRGGQDRHMHRGGHRELAAGHLAAHGLHRDTPVPRHHSGQGRNLDIRHGSAVCFGEAAVLGLRETDIAHVARADVLEAAGVDAPETIKDVRAVATAIRDQRLMSNPVAMMSGAGWNFAQEFVKP